MGETVEFPSNGHTCSGYLASPDEGSGPGVVVIQEWWGLVPHIRSVCDRFAVEGFVALAPDLYHGKQAKEPDEAGKLLMEMQLEDAGRDMKGAAAWLISSERCKGDRVGVVGFCAGGALALYAATLSQQFGAAVGFYPYLGRTEDARPDYGAVSGPVLAHFGDRDEAYTRDQVDRLQEQLRSSGQEATFHWYEADHAFFNDDRPEVFDRGATDIAWQRTLDFLRDSLGAADVPV